MIVIQNIYYMLSYAFKILNADGYRKLATEEFSNTSELMAAILARGVSVQLKRGLGKEYILESDELSSLRGKIGISESIKTQALMKKKMVCYYDEFSVNTTMNRIIKSTMELLLKAAISKSRKKELRKVLVFFGDVETVNLEDVNWHLNYHRNNQTYQLLISICYLVVKGLLQNEADGTIKLMNFLKEKQMSRLYEKFLLEYYKKHFPELSVSASQIPWSLDDGMNRLH